MLLLLISFFFNSLSISCYLGELATYELLIRCYGTFLFGDYDYEALGIYIFNPLLFPDFPLLNELRVD